MMYFWPVTNDAKALSGQAADREQQRSRGASKQRHAKADGSATESGRTGSHDVSNEIQGPLAVLDRVGDTHLRPGPGSRGPVQHLGHLGQIVCKRTDIRELRWKRT